MIFMGVLGKISAVLTTIPEPVVGGMFMVMFGVITATGISNLQVNRQEPFQQPELKDLFYQTRALMTLMCFPVKSTDMNSSRTIFIFGFSMFSALAIPNWMVKNPGFLQTGSLSLLLSSF